MPADDSLSQVLAYHQRTKHHFERYAASPGYLDWATQPDPFRWFEGAEQIPLPLKADDLDVAFADLFQAGRVPPAPMSLDSTGALFELAFGLSAWKAYGGDRWALRCNPSSGNLHPTEAYAVAGHGIDGLSPGVYHYRSDQHSLERRCQAELPFDGLLVGLSSIHWREAWKYGERAYRYCQHDVGHALGALRYAAGVLGWRVRLLEGWSDGHVARLLGLDRDGDFGPAEREAPDLLCRVGPPPKEPLPIESLVGIAKAGQWTGRANVLSPRHSHQWPVIEEVHRATVKRHSDPASPEFENLPPLLSARCDRRASSLIRERRSAQAFDGTTAIPADALWRLLDATLPRADTPPWDAWPWPPRIHFLMFLHRVTGLPPGLYLMPRSAGREPDLRTQVRDEFGCEGVDGCPGHIHLIRLVQADCRGAARNVSCHQDIAGDSAFSLGMLAEFDEPLAREGAWHYRRLFWESGLIGQILYLEAEAAGVRGTGIGCFFDDAVHQLLGLQDSRYQSLYHFTIGGPLVDRRLQTLPPYAHLQR